MSEFQNSGTVERYFKSANLKVKPIRLYNEASRRDVLALRCAYYVGRYRDGQLVEALRIDGFGNSERLAL